MPVQAEKTRNALAASGSDQFLSKEYVMPACFHVQRFVDGKLGHENQTLGLLNALAQKITLTHQDISVGSDLSALGKMVVGFSRVGTESKKRPDLIMGAGRRTHFPMLSARRRFGAPAVVLMAPSPMMMPHFDLCIIPQHDDISGPRVVNSLGTLTSVRPGIPGDPQKGLFLIGGPSNHHGWNTQMVVESVLASALQEPTVRWKVTTSRRTPRPTVQSLTEITSPRIEVFPLEATGPDWLRQELSEASRTWVTEDSISMIFDSLTAGNRTGVLPVPRKRKRSRVYRCVDQMIGSGHLYVSRLAPNHPTFVPNNTPLDEATRIADILIEKFLLTPELKAG